MFNPIDYIHNLQQGCTLTTGFKFVQVTGLNTLEGVLSNSKRHRKFIAIDDTDEGATIKRGGAFYERRLYTVFILEGFKLDDMEDRQAKMASAREIFRAFLAKINSDSEYFESEDLIYFDNERIDFYEFPGYVGAEATGLYFTFTVENPINLTVNDALWNQ